MNFVPDSAPAAFQSPCVDVSKQILTLANMWCVRGRAHISFELDEFETAAVHRDDVHRFRRVLLGVGLGRFEDVG